MGEGEWATISGDDSTADDSAAVESSSESTRSMAPSFASESSDWKTTKPCISLSFAMSASNPLDGAAAAVGRRESRDRPPPLFPAPEQAEDSRWSLMLSARTRRPHTGQGTRPADDWLCVRSSRQPAASSSLLSMASSSDSA